MRLPFDHDAVLPFGSFTVSVADDASQRQQVADWLEAEHFLGSFRPVRHSLAQVVFKDGAPVALVQWAACAYHLKDREAWIGWDAQGCARRRNLIINNARLLVPAALRTRSRACCGRDRRQRRAAARDCGPVAPAGAGAARRA